VVDWCQSTDQGFLSFIPLFAAINCRLSACKGNIAVEGERIGLISYRKSLPLPKITPFSLLNVVFYRKFTAGKRPQGSCAVSISRGAGRTVLPFPLYCPTLDIVIGVSVCRSANFRNFGRVPALYIVWRAHTKLQYSIFSKQYNIYTNRMRKTSST
jgi:hypothetical protein